MAKKHNDDLFDERVVFQFYFKSRDVLPGKGQGERLPDELARQYSDLGKMKDWRKKLSNFYPCELRIDGLKWASVEHYYHANKYKMNCPEFYRRFSLSYEPGEREPRWIKDLPRYLSVEPAVAKSLGGKTGKYKGISYRPKSLQLDDGFFQNRHSDWVMAAAQAAKYEQNPGLADVLLATKNAKLIHFVRGQPPVPFYDTMEMRSRLQHAAKS